MPTATAVACANIAFIKYWGNLQPALRLPYNDSLSMNLSAATTRTTVRFDPDLPEDRLTVDDERRLGGSLQRVVAQLELIRARAGLVAHAEVRSTNSFPMGTGIASSASGFAALTVAAAAAAGLELSEAECSALARRASGSAARSIPGGFVQWHTATVDEGSFARTIAPAAHWDLRDLVAVVSRTPKAVSSTDGHAAAVLSPYFPARLAELPGRLARVRQALLERDLAAMGPAVEAEAISLHVVALSGQPAVLYWSPATVALLHQVRAWRAQGLPVYFTLDAGPNVHLLCEARHAATLEQELQALDYVESVIHNRPGEGARVVAGA
jgi:diphosphomevalonate decarboxylase